MLINNRIKLEVTGHIARVTLARPEKMNAIDPDMFAARANGWRGTEKRQIYSCGHTRCRG